MYDFIRIQYILNNLAPEQVLAFAPRFITEEQADAILAGGQK